MESERFAEGFGKDGRVCTPCRRVAPGFTRAVAYGVYAEEMRELVHLLKYERVRGLERPLGAMLAGAVELLDEEMAGGGEMLVVAVPLFGAKEAWAGVEPCGAAGRCGGAGAEATAAGVEAARGAPCAPAGAGDGEPVWADAEGAARQCAGGVCGAGRARC